MKYSCVFMSLNIYTFTYTFPSTKLIIFVLSHSMIRNNVYSEYVVMLSSILTPFDSLINLNATVAVAALF